MKGTPSRCVRSASRAARSIAWRSLSMTHGPAMRTNGLPPPIERSSRATGITGSLYRRDENYQTHLTYVTSKSRYARSGARRRMRRPAAVARFDEARKQRMRMERLRLEFRMELHREVPRMVGQLGDLDELAVGRAARNPKAVLDERPLVQAVELVAVAMPLVNEGRAVNALRQ